MPNINQYNRIVDMLGIPNINQYIPNSIRYIPNINQYNRLVLGIYRIIISIYRIYQNKTKNPCSKSASVDSRWLLILWHRIPKYISELHKPGSVFSYKLRYIVGFWLVEMAISTNQKPTIYRKLYENTAPVRFSFYGEWSANTFCKYSTNRRTAIWLNL